MAVKKFRKPKSGGGKATPKNKALYSRVKAEAKRKFDVYIAKISILNLIYCSFAVHPL